MERGSEARREPERGPTVIEPSALPAYSEDGVDLTLIRWMLSLSPAQRLDELERAAASLLDLRNGLRRH